MLRRILVPLDGSRFAEQALPTALRLARRDAADLDLVRVEGTPLPAALAGTAPVRDPAFDREVLQHAESYLAEVAGEVDADDRSRVTTALLLGDDTVDALLNHIRDRSTGLVVMTTNARGGISRAWLGSVADALVRRSPVPVLLLRPEEEATAADAPYTDVLLPLDGAPDGERIVDHALAVAGTEGVRYTLLRVLDSPDIRALRATVESTMETTAERLRARGLDVRVRTSMNDSPARGILEHAEENGSGLIAMMTRSRGGVQRLLLGSVADKVLRGSTRPLLVLNPGVEHPATAGQTSTITSNPP